MPPVSINLSRDLIHLLDAEAESQSRSRSNLVETILRAALGEGPAVGQPAVSGSGNNILPEPEPADPTPE